MIVRAALLWLSLLAAMIVFRRVLLPFGAALLLAYVLEPLVSRIAGLKIGRRPVPRWAGILGLYAVFFVLLYGFSIAAVPQLYREGVRLTAEAKGFLNELTPEKVAGYTRTAEAWLATHGIPVVFGEEGPVPSLENVIGADGGEGLFGQKVHIDLGAAIRQSIASGSLWAGAHLLDLMELSKKVVASVASGIFFTFFLLMASAFLLLDTDATRSFFRSMVPWGWRDGYDGLLSAIDVKLSGVVRGQIVICLVNGTLTLVGLLLLKVKFALLLATIATVLSFIPIFGTIISTIPIVLVGLTQSFATATGALAWVLGIHAVEAYLLNPKILGDSAKIHPALIAFALLAGESTFGFAGALFAVPVTSILLATFLFFKERADRLQETELAAIATSSTVGASPPAPPASTTNLEVG